MDLNELFNDLESTNSMQVEQSKKILSENFINVKENWLVYGMMEYFNQTNSSRAVDVLVKVRDPHDTHIFDKLLDWVNGPNKNQAITLFGFIVEKHPSWLHKVANHQLLKDVLKLLKTEQNIITIMSALFCIITLLPIIPTSMPQYLQDLFDIFSYLASWNCTNEPRLTDDQQIHLQIGLSTFFQRLYGMYPCNFLAFLTKSQTDRHRVYCHTIKPLLDTVKIHPLLLTHTVQTEKSTSRWKEMEPHDIVVECSKLCLENANRFHHKSDYFSPIAHRNPEYTSYSNNKTSFSIELQQSLRNTPSSMASPFYSLFNEPKDRLKEAQRIDSLWSPSIAVLATPPPTGNIPHTPTPTPNIPNYGIPTLPGSHLCASGASPPEAAIEATPETTPMKDNMKPLRQFPMGSAAARAILGSTQGSTSQPSSPIMKKEPSPFRFPDFSTSQSLQSEGNQSKKLLSLVQDRKLCQMQILEKLNQHQDGSNIRDVETIQIENSIDERNKNEVSLEDEEVKEINSQTLKAFHGAGSIEMDLKNSNSIQLRQPYPDETTTIECSKSWPCDSNRMIDCLKNISENGNSNLGGIDNTSNINLQKKREALKSRTLRLKPTDIDDACERTTVGTQTVEQLPPTYEKLLVCANEPAAPSKTTNSLVGSTPMSPHTLLDQYIETSIKKKHSKDNNNQTEHYRDQIQLLNIQLRYEQYRREVHAERNRRMLGKSRLNAVLEMENEKLKEEKEKLVRAVDDLTNDLNKSRIMQTRRDQDYSQEVNTLKRDIQQERDEKKQLLLQIENLQRRLGDEKNEKKDISQDLEAARAELFDLRNELQQTQYQADLGLQYKDEFNRLQSEIVLMGEIHVKCRDKLSELNDLRGRDVEQDALTLAYENEIREMRTALDIKSSQLDTAKARLAELELDGSRRDSKFTDQKRLLKTVKEEYQEKFLALESKYDAQKAIILRLEEEILDLYKNQTAVNLVTLSPDSEKTDMAGSLDHTSPLSISLASSEGLSASLRSVTEIKNLHPLVVQQDLTAFNKPSTSTPSSAAAAASGATRQTVSEDIPVPNQQQHFKNSHLHRHQ
ncbi:hamartin [Bradysia coprophila]|uniref:hamartin n=1 Tax=Bradysia coprophila TaxID=38358 RepID=UPI00187D7B5B|nr:hamartin [Bradysia coprophila]